MAQDALPSAGGTSTTTADVANAKNRNLSLSQIATSLSDSSSAVVTALASIAAAITASIIGGSTGGVANALLRAKGTGGRALKNSAITVDDSGNVSGVVSLAASATVSANTVSADTGTFTSSLTKGGNSVAITTQTVCASFTFKFPEDEFVILVINAPFAWTITSTSTITEVGTSTVTVSISGTPLGGSANSASTSLNTQAHSSSNNVAVTSSLGVTFSSTSSNCENLCLTITGTRVLS